MMEQGGIYIWWHWFRKGEVSGQVATLITLAIAVIFLFVAVTLNISRVSQKKTATSKAADGAALKLASYVGSYANKLSWEQLKGGVKKCRRRWGTFFKILAVVVLIVIAFCAFAAAAQAAATSAPQAAAAAEAAGATTEVATAAGQAAATAGGTAAAGGASATEIAAAAQTAAEATGATAEAAAAAGKAVAATWAAEGGTVGTLSSIGAVVSGVAAGLNEFVFEPRVVSRMQRQLNKLSLGLNFSEQAMMYALRASVDDPAKVVDVHDYDEDGDTTDEINRFSQWYAQRLDALSESAGSQEVQIDSFIPSIDSFAQQADAFRRDFSEDATRPLAVEDDCPECTEEEEPELAPAGQDGGFVSLLEELDSEGIEVSFWIPGADTEENTDEVDELSGDLNTFYLWALGQEGGLLQQDFDKIVQMYDMWMPQLYTEDESAPEEDEGQSWYYTWDEQIARIDDWRPELYGAISQLEEMIGEEPDPVRIDYLRNLQNRTSSAINRLDDFQDTLSGFNNDTLVFYNQSNPDEQNRATYSWHDSLGWHHVRVEVSRFGMPYIKVKKRKRKICIYLRGHSGNVTVKVTRFDENTAASFARRENTPLWKFRYAKDAQAAGNINPANAEQALAYGITSEATAAYSYASLPRLVRTR